MPEVLEAYVYGVDFVFAQRVRANSNDELVRKAWNMVAERVVMSRIPIKNNEGDVMPVLRVPEDFAIRWPEELK